jgi:predicted GNAT family N-acyltransferase
MSRPGPVSVRRMSWSDPGERARAAELRTQVFVGEQNVPADLELDALDATAYHVLALSGDETVGTGRMVVEGGRARIGRMAVRASQRGTGVGALLLQALLEWARELKLRDAYLHSQCHAMGFYAKHGFQPVGPVFQEAGIDHQEMELAL